MRPATPGDRDPLGGHLQRADHRRADPAGPARRALPAARRGGDAAPQPARLRARRHHRAVHRHQAHRPRRLTAPRDDRDHDDLPLVRQLRRALRIAARAHRAARRRLPARRHRASARLASPSQADGSLVQHDGRVVGSSLLGQAFTEPTHAGFHGRPVGRRRTTGSTPAAARNLGPDQPDLLAAVPSAAPRTAAQNGAGRRRRRAGRRA